MSLQPSIAHEMLQRLPQGVAAISQDAEILCINRFLVAMIGMEGTTLSLPLQIECEECPPNLRMLLSPCVHQAVGPYELDTGRLGWPGSSRTLHVEPYSTQTQDSSCTLVTVADVTSARTTEETRAEFIAQVAHELRTPLQHIMGFAGIMSDMDGLSSEDYQRFSSQVHSETRVMARLISDLDELARITGGRFVVDRELVDLKSLIERVAARAEPGARKNGLSLDWVVPPNPVLVQGDSIRLTQVLVNLVENAIKYVPEGGHIQVGLVVREDQAVVSVADNGKGIPADAVKHVFEQFFQVHKGGQRSHRGMGLGLYISREIMHAHDGQIWVESEQGKGSTFFFSLALACQSEENS